MLHSHCTKEYTIRTHFDYVLEFRLFGAVSAAFKKRTVCRMYQDRKERVLLMYLDFHVLLKLCLYRDRYVPKPPSRDSFDWSHDRSHERSALMTLLGLTLLLRT